jgi:multicomponent Na+:H+ antiporter subunit F
MTVIYAVVGVMFTIAALLIVFRIVRGPSILDRMIASDVLLTTLILVVGAEMVYNGHTRTIPLMVVLAATAIFATIAVARYVSKQDRVAVPAVGGDVPGDGPLHDVDVPTEALEDGLIIAQPTDGGADEHDAEEAR